MRAQLTRRGPAGAGRQVLVGRGRLQAAVGEGAAHREVIQDLLCRGAESRADSNGEHARPHLGMRRRPPLISSEWLNSAPHRGRLRGTKVIEWSSSAGMALRWRAANREQE